MTTGTAVAVVLIAVQIVVVTTILIHVGGAPHPFVHLYYVPIIFAATRLGWRSAVVTAAPAGLLAGPLGALLFGLPTPPDSSWVVREVMYVVIGLLVATLSRQASRSITSTLRDAVQARRLRHALDHAALEVHYQPIVDLGSDAVVGVEALCRWQDSAGVNVPPSVFIPLAERTGVILGVGRFVLRETTRQCAAWAALGLDHLVANVNVSAEQLSDPAFLSDVSAALADSGLRPGQLCLEITETTIIRNPEAALATVSAAHSLGILIALDDFGTGHSSLAYLKDFPIDVIKIDRSFVAEMDHDAKCSTLVLAIIEMARALGATSIAEGIERQSQLDSLRTLGCEGGQGFLLGRPGPAPAPDAAWLGRMVRKGLAPPTQRSMMDPAARGSSAPHARRSTA